MTENGVTIPSVFREGHAKARVINLKLAQAYTENTGRGDPLADAAIASLADLDRTAAVRLIQAGVDQGKEALKDAPEELREFFATVASPPPPGSGISLDPQLALDGSRAFFRDSDMFLVSLIAAGLIDNVATLMGQSFLATGYTTQAGVQRLRTSLKQVLESMIPGGLELYGDGWKLTVWARLIHAQARRNVLQSGNWDSAEYGSPISAAHVAYATAAFSSGVLRGLSKLGVKPSRQEREGYVHNWRYIGWLMGVPDEILIGNEQEGAELLRIARICEPPPNLDSIIMAHTLVNSAAMGLVGRDDRERFRKEADYVYRISRGLIGNELADQLDFPQRPTALLMAGLRWKRRLTRVLGRASRTARAESFIVLLEGTDVDSDGTERELPDHRYA